MAKKQTRRSVSIRGTTYAQIRAYCERQGLSMSEFVEQRIAAFFTQIGEPRLVASSKKPATSARAVSSPALQPTHDAPTTFGSGRDARAQVPSTRIPRAVAPVETAGSVTSIGSRMSSSSSPELGAPVRTSVEPVTDLSDAAPRAAVADRTPQAASLDDRRQSEQDGDELDLEELQDAARNFRF